jgi:hypothetical protein
VPSQNLVLGMACALLEKLEPMSMMQEDGLKKATLAISLLQRKADSEPGLASEILEAKGGVMILLQTALLHPEPLLRTGATAVITACVRNESFLEAALDKNLPSALVRLCAEQDRRVKPQGADHQATDGETPKAIDPDLPSRRIAVECLEHLLLRADPAVALRAMADRALCGTLFSLMGNSDADIRRRAAAMLLALVVADDGTGSEHAAPQLRGPLIAYAEAEAEKCAPLFASALLDGESEVRVAAASILRSLKSSSASAALRGQMVNIEAAQVLAGQETTYEDVDDIIEWLTP